MNREHHRDRRDHERKTGDREGAAAIDRTGKILGLVRKSAGGDGRAFGELVRMHQDEIFGLVSRMVRNREIAEELTQDIFMKAYRGLGKFQEKASFSTWIYRIAVNHVRDHVTSRGARDHSRESSLDSEELAAFEPVSALPGPEEHFGEAEAAGLFRRALESLEQHMKEAFLLRHQEGRNYDELAVILGITRSNAKVRVHRAREKILAALRAGGYEV